LLQSIYCDNAKNFVGAANKMKDFQTALLELDAINLLESYSACKRFSFCFISPRSPQFGCLWEAAVKSAKTLLLKNIVQSNFKYEEPLTVLAEVEAILNSRPIEAVSDDPNDEAASRQPISSLGHLYCLHQMNLFTSRGRRRLQVALPHWMATRDIHQATFLAQLEKGPSRKLASRSANT